MTITITAKAGRAPSGVLLGQESATAPPPELLRVPGEGTCLILSFVGGLWSGIPESGGAACTLIWERWQEPDFSAPKVCLCPSVPSSSLSPQFSFVRIKGAGESSMWKALQAAAPDYGLIPQAQSRP